ncbi:MAG: CDP-diacylglycerol--glycerol-3-phosphate 3-phosphatidyltransferase [Pseudomonadales bacterium]|jgi:CDP-diacylglycerol--glycerol-3-phosphate 3-phosphatidyltransferase|nr:CDP-diacylglycerol--glycerol-3-phosphate 3-phosphatidyltransferase [Pseudomonadales bacterium]MCP5338171.1 CDP-diacylglycerol--glycerol-3-phosphate 3-phosphatidyltransferase [Pseudomonadales bacterium]
MNIPNALTLFRIALIPVFVVLFYLPFTWSYLAAAAVFVLASLTDWLDGYLARRLNQSTLFGAFLDPVADKLMVVIAIVLLVSRFDSAWFTVPALVVVGREILVSALREWMAEIGKRTSVAVSWLGKLKTFLQMVAIILLVAAEPGVRGQWLVGGFVLFCAAAVLTLWSAVVYLRAAWADLSAAANRPGPAN